MPESRPLTLIALWFVAAGIASGVWWNVPLIDDWTYAWSVERLLATGRFETLDWSGNFALGQVLWGAAWSAPHGVFVRRASSVDPRVGTDRLRRAVRDAEGFRGPSGRCGGRRADVGGQPGVRRPFGFVHDRRAVHGVHDLLAPVLCKSRTIQQAPVPVVGRLLGIRGVHRSAGRYRRAARRCSASLHPGPVACLRPPDGRCRPWGRRGAP